MTQLSFIANLRNCGKLEYIWESCMHNEDAFGCTIVEGMFLLK